MNEAGPHGCRIQASGLFPAQEKWIGNENVLATGGAVFFVEYPHHKT
jgi:hypothetical protein